MSSSSQVCELARDLPMIREENIYRSTPIKQCVTCGEKSMKTCRTCKSVGYCAKSECVESDLEMHYLLCSEFVDYMKTSPRPGSCILALYFPVKGSVQFVWFDVKTSTIVKKDLASGYLLQRKAYGDDEPELEDFEIICNYNTNKAIDHNLNLRYRLAFRSEGALLNESVVSLCTGEQKDRWGGPLIVFATETAPVISEPGCSEDISVADLTTMVAFFKNYKDDNHSYNKQNKNGKATNATGDVNDGNPKNTNNKEPRFVKGVEIASEGDQRFLKMEKFVTVDVPGNHVVFNQRKGIKPADLSVHLGIPIFVYKLGRCAEWEKTITKGFTNFAPWGNRAALFLNHDLNARSDEFGFADMMEWDRDIGRVLVVRQDKKDITAHQVDALANFSRFRLSDLITEEGEDHYELEDEEMYQAREEFIKQEICQQKFEKFFQEYRKKKIDKGDSSWEGAVSPYSA